MIAEAAHAQRFGGGHVLVAPDRQHQPADHARQPRPSDERKDRHDAEVDLLAREVDGKHRAQRDDQIEGGDAQEQFRAAHDHRVGHPAEVARDAAEQQAERERNEDADEADRQ